MSDPWLSEDQVADLTKRKRPADQIKVLVRDGVPFITVAGRPVVMVSDLSPVAQSPARPQVRKLG